MELAEGAVHGDEKLLRRGYFDLLAAIDGWPEFNLFTAGYVLSRLPVTDRKYAEAVDYQWRNLDVCVGEKVDRRTAEYAKYMALETAGRSRDGASRIRQRQALQDVPAVAVQVGARGAHRAGGRERCALPRAAARRENAHDDGHEQVCLHGLSPELTAHFA